MLQYKLDRKYEEINNFCDANGLKRDYSRELVSEQIPNKTVANSNSKYYNNIQESYPITDNSIIAVKNVKIDGLNERQCQIAFEQRKRLLQAMQNEDVGIEGSVSFTLDGFEASQIKKGGYGKTGIYESSKPFYAIHNHSDNGVLSPQDLIEFLKRPNLKAFESIGNDGLTMSIIVKTEKSNAYGYNNFIIKETEKFKRDILQSKTYSFDKLNEFSISLLKKGEIYGFKTTNIVLRK